MEFSEQLDNLYCSFWVKRDWKQSLFSGIMEKSALKRGILFLTTVYIKERC